MPKEYPRKFRVAVELQRLLNDLLRAEIKDPRLVGVTVTEVELGASMSLARVFFSMLNPDGDPSGAQAAFAKAAGFMRFRAGQTLHVRRVPELHFVHDTSARRGAEITHMLDVVNRETGDGDSRDD